MSLAFKTCLPSCVSSSAPIRLRLNLNSSEWLLRISLLEISVTGLELILKKKQGKQPQQSVIVDIHLEFLYYFYVLLMLVMGNNKP